MCPAPVSVEHDRGRLRRAAVNTGAFLPGERWVILCGIRADLLAEHEGEKSEKSSERALHV